MKKVLIVDDEKSFLLPLRDRLRRTYGDRFAVLTAENGQEAIQTLEQTTVDLLVTDLEMPVVDGFELLAWTSRERPGLGVIVITAPGNTELEGRLAHHHPLHCLRKPFEFETLAKAILTGLENSDKSYIRGVGLATFLQLMHLEKKSCALKITCDKRRGYLYLHDGELIDAECGVLKGEEAAYEIITWQETAIEVNQTDRRAGPIRRPLEMILLDAFRLIDEKSESVTAERETLRAPPRPALEAIKAATEPSANKEATEPAAEEAPVLELATQLAQLFNSHPSIREYAWFDRNGSLSRKNNGGCSLEGLDPAIYLHLTGPLKEKLGFGTPNYISFFVASRAHVLLFNLTGCSLFVKLQEGARPEVVAKEISGAINGDRPQSSLS